MNIGCRSWVMSGDVAQWIRPRLKENIITIVGGSGERSWGGISASVQSDVKMANQTENLDRSAVRPLLLRFLDRFVPKCTEVTL